MVLTLTTTLSFLSPRPPFSLLLLLRFKNPNLTFSSFSSMAPSSSIIAEYAKSNRSKCKSCENTITANSLRLGVVTKDKQRGFDMTKWHHLHCLSFDSDVASADAIGGFASLKSDDQEALKLLVAKCGQTRDGDDDIAVGEKQKSKKMKIRDGDDNIAVGEKQKSKKRKAQDRDEDEAVGNRQESTKKEKLLASEDAKVEVALSVADIKERYRDATLPPKWKAFHTVIFLEKDDGLQDSSKIAAFDFDGCLAKTSVKRVGADKWSLMYSSIPEKLQKLYNDGFKLVIFTNESNIDRWKNQRQVAVDSKVGRLNNFIMHVKVPLQVFIACGFDKSGSKDPYRKPKPGMWHSMEKHFNSGIAVDMDQSFYVGDAAGRKNDHSDADIKFAQAIGLKFYVPEKFFSA